MNVKSNILFCVTIMLLTACGPGKISSGKRIKNDHDISLIAWNEDTVHSYTIYLSAKDTAFSYIVVRNDSLKIKKEYQGTFSKQRSYDTLFLKYDHNDRPEGATNYLIREVSGTYLIQPFENTTKRIFLRIQHWDSRSMSF